MVIDLSAPWHFSASTMQREAPGRGRYRVRARFGTGKPGAYTYCTVNYWLPADTGSDPHAQWLAIREIVNSREHPSVFEDRELPSTIESEE